MCGTDKQLIINCTNLHIPKWPVQTYQRPYSNKTPLTHRHPYYMHAGLWVQHACAPPFHSPMCVFVCCVYKRNHFVVDVSEQYRIVAETGAALGICCVMLSRRKPRSSSHRSTTCHVEHAKCIFTRPKYLSSKCGTDCLSIECMSACVWARAKNLQCEHQWTHSEPCRPNHPECPCAHVHAGALVTWARVRTHAHAICRRRKNVGNRLRTTVTSLKWQTDVGAAAAVHSARPLTPLRRRRWRRRQRQRLTYLYMILCACIMLWKQFYALGSTRNKHSASRRTARSIDPRSTVSCGADRTWTSHVDSIWNYVESNEIIQYYWLGFSHCRLSDLVV